MTHKGENPLCIVKTSKLTSKLLPTYVVIVLFVSEPFIVTLVTQSYVVFLLFCYRLYVSREVLIRDLSKRGRSFRNSYNFVIYIYRPCNIFTGVYHSVQWGGYALARGHIRHRGGRVHPVLVLHKGGEGTLTR